MYDMEKNMAEEKLKLLQITLYGEDDEIKDTYTRSFVPWKLLKQAVRISKEMDPANIKEEDIDLLAGLVVEVFGNKFSVADLNDGADVEAMIAVLNTILSKARLNMPGNPTLPPAK